MGKTEELMNLLDQIEAEIDDDDGSKPVLEPEPQTVSSTETVLQLRGHLEQKSNSRNEYNNTHYSAEDDFQPVAQRYIERPPEFTTKVTLVQTRTNDFFAAFGETQ